MQWGISLNISSDFEKSLWSLPPPSGMRWLSKIDGTKILQVLYHFEYTPQSWKEWQRIASIKIQMKKLVPHIVFNEYDFIDEVRKVYTISELGSYLPKFVKFHKPLYPHDKNEFMRCLTYYCQRLYYEKMLHIEAIIAMALHFNSKGGYGYSYREIMKKANSVLLLDMSQWNIKLSKYALKKAHSKGGHITVTKKREKFQLKREEALILRKDGMLLSDIAIHLNISIATVKRWKLPKV